MAASNPVLLLSDPTMGLIAYLVHKIAWTPTVASSESEPPCRGAGGGALQLAISAFWRVGKSDSIGLKKPRPGRQNAPTARFALTAGVGAGFLFKQVAGILQL